MKRILIDTNIFIPREDYREVPDDLQKLLKTLNRLQVQILIHPKSIEDVYRDPNNVRKKIIISKIKTYPELENPPDYTKDDYFISITGESSKPNDYVDNALLYAIYKHAVHFLITEDREILKKAKKLNIKERVLSIIEALREFGKDIKKEKVSIPPALKVDYVYNLNINDPFFDSLKSDYPGFKEWFTKISEEGRKCFVYYKDNGKIGALLIYKIENGPIMDSSPVLPSKNRLKLCTFKVETIAYGRKIGELFIKLSIEYAVKNNLSEVYLTLFPEGKEKLLELLTDFGFFKTAKKNNGEDIYVKDLLPDGEKLRSIKPSEISKEFWPYFYDGPQVNKFIIPIRPEYHERLFIGYKVRQTRLCEHEGEFIIEGNTIGKAYLCHSKAKKINKGDVLLFYRSKDNKELTTIGVVERIYRNLQDAERIWDIVKRRTVYSQEEIEKMAKKPTMIILFRRHFHLPNPLKLDEMIRMNVLRGAPQSITEISQNNYLKIKNRGGIDERFAVN